MAKSNYNYKQRKANPIETDSISERINTASELTKTSKAIKDQLGSGHDFISQLLGLDYNLKSMTSNVEMKKGEVIDLKSNKIDKNPQYTQRSETTKIENRPNVLPGIDYRREIVHGSERLSRKETQQLQERIQEIMKELTKLISTSAILQAEFVEVSVEQVPQKAGKYHLNFFEWLLTVIKNMRLKAEDAGAWLSVMKSKKSQRKYGNMAKKHGTSYTLANERTPATQTG